MGYQEMAGEWRKLHIQELYELCSSLSIIRMIKPARTRCTGHTTRIGEKDAYGLVRKHERKRYFGKPSRRRDGDIEVNVKNNI